MEMQFIVAIQLAAAGWILLAVTIAVLLASFACSVFSLQMCMAYFGEELPTYLGCVGLKLKIVVAVSATMLVAYAFLGPLAILGGPAAFVVALMMIGNAARCDRFHAAIIVLSHSMISSLAAGLCVFVCWVGLSAMGFNAANIQSEIASLRHENASYGAFSDKESRRSPAQSRNVSHSNPFVATAGSGESNQ